MKEIIKITSRLTLTCLMAGAVMGLAFTVTFHAKKHNEHQDVQETMVKLLGYGNRESAPRELELYPIYRYVVQEGEKKSLGYVIPLAGDRGESCALLSIDLEGNYLGCRDIDVSPERARETSERDRALQALGLPRTFRYADTVIVAKLGDKRIAYLVSGEFPGFKTTISVMLALDTDFAMLGLEILEHEEDPGLGAEIEEEYFKNQFQGKNFKKIKDLKVIKEPLPEEYRMGLESKRRHFLAESELTEIRGKYRSEDIHALTGATISSTAVTRGVKDIVKKIAYRMQILDRVIGEQKLAVPF